MPLERRNPLWQTSISDVVVASVEGFVNGNCTPDSSVRHSLGKVKEFLRMGAARSRQSSPPSDDPYGEGRWARIMNPLWRRDNCNSWVQGKWGDGTLSTVTVEDGPASHLLSGSKCSRNNQFHESCDVLISSVTNVYKVIGQIGKFLQTCSCSWTHLPQ